MIVVFDLDGTICFNGKEIPQGIQRELLNLIDLKHTVIFASARPVRDMLPLLEEDTLSRQLLIGGNGSITHEHHTLQAQAYIDPTIFETIKEMITAMNLDYLIDTEWDYAKKITVPNSIENKIDAQQLAECIPMDAVTKAIKIILLNLNEEQITQIERRLAREAVVMLRHSESLNLDITAQHINKYETLKTFIQNKPYIAFGNDHNDIDLLKNATFSVSVGTNPATTAVASTTVEANEQAVMQAIRSLV